MSDDTVVLMHMRIELMELRETCGLLSDRISVHVAENASLAKRLEEAERDAERWRALVWYSVMQEGAAEMKFWRTQLRHLSDDVGKDVDQWAQLGGRNG